MSQGRLSQNAYANEATERTPLIPQPPTSVDVPPEALADTEGRDDEEQPQPNGHLPNGNGTINPNTKPTNPSANSNNQTSANQTITLARGALGALALGLLIFLQATNISLLTTTQSDIAGDLDAFEKTSWFTSAYLIAMSALGPLNGKLASVFGPRICIFASTVVLALGSLWTGWARSFEAFIAGRVVTGVGASGIFTVAIIITLELSGSKRRGLAIGLLNMGYTIGVAVGATAAGAMLPVLGWRWLFWMQAPVSLLGGFTLLLAIPRTFHAGTQSPGHEPTNTNTSTTKSTLHRLARLDYLGALTLTTSITLFLFALSSPRRIPWPPILASALVLLLFILNELHLASDPVIPVTLLKSRGLFCTCLATVGYMMARWSVLFYTPTYALAVRGWSPASAGSILVPTNFGFAVGGLVVGVLHVKRQGSFYFPTLVVYALFPFTLVALALISTPDSSPLLYLAVVFSGGFVTGAALNYNLAHLLHLTPPSTHYIATSLLATFRGFAGSFGSAIGGGLFTRTLYTSLEDGFADRGMGGEEDLVRRLLGSPKLVRMLEGAEAEVARQGYQDALKTLFYAGAVLAVVMVFVQAGTGWTAPQEEEKQEAEEEGAEGGYRDEDDEVRSQDRV